MYDKSIIILLTNDLTNICSEISKIWLILWMLLAMWKGLKKLKSWVEINVLYIVDQDTSDGWLQ